MLYPTEIVDFPLTDTMLAAASGSMVAVPLLIGPRQGLMIAMAQLSATQDYSLRAWVSREVGGAFVPTISSSWHLGRAASQLVLVLDAFGIAPGSSNVLLVPVIPGSYYLNILNLVGAENVFSFSASAILC